MEEYEGIISKVIFYNPENKYIVAVFETDDEEITITGNMSYINNDDRYRIKGNYVTHPRYGKQFKVSSYEIILADDRGEIIRYLSSPLFKGVGKKMAERIVDALGEKALTTIKKNPECLNGIPHMSETIKNNIVGIHSWRVRSRRSQGTTGGQPLPPRGSYPRRRSPQYTSTARKGRRGSDNADG